MFSLRVICFALHGLSFVKAVYDRKDLQNQYPGFGKDFILVPSETGEDCIVYFKEDDRPKIKTRRVESLYQQVFYKYYNSELPSGVEFRDASELSKYFERKRKTVLITHGWISSIRSEYIRCMKGAFINKTDLNVIVMDWSKIADNIYYPIPMKKTWNVAEHYAKLLNFIVDDLNTDPKDMHLIGHSLGAHVSGFAARRVKKGKVGRITGLDPALPGFASILSKYGSGHYRHLNKNDSHFVDVIHTCAGFLGFIYPIGHVDFYPNGGIPPQPGCAILKFTEACSHGKSWKLFKETIISGKAYVANNCRTLRRLRSRKCGGIQIPMGYQTPASARGIYFTNTDASGPVNFDSK